MKATRRKVLNEAFHRSGIQDYYGKRSDLFSVIIIKILFSERPISPELKAFSFKVTVY